MKSFKEHLKEDEISPDVISAPEPPVPEIDPDTGVVEKQSCDDIRRMIDHYREEVEEAQRNHEKAADKWSDACGGSDVDRAVWCAKFCGGGGEWGPSGLRDEACMERCLAETEQHCEDLFDALMAALDNLNLMELFLAAYERDLVEQNCVKDVPGKSTRKPDSKAPTTGVTPIEPTIRPNIK